MPIVGRTAKECLDAFRDHVAGLFADLLNNRMRLAFERAKVAGVERATLGFLQGDDLVPIRLDTAKHGALDLYISQELAAVEDGKKSFRLETWAYAYRLHVGNEPVIRWEYERRPKNRYPRHHVQIHATAEAGGTSFDLKHLHTPTGWVTFEEVLRFVFEDLGVTPLRADWESRLETSERQFYETFTSKRFHPQK